MTQITSLNSQETGFLGPNKEDNLIYLIRLSWTAIMLFEDRKERIKRALRFSENFYFSLERATRSVFFEDKEAADAW